MERRALVASPPVEGVRERYYRLPEGLEREAVTSKRGANVYVSDEGKTEEHHLPFPCFDYSARSIFWVKAGVAMANAACLADDCHQGLSLLDTPQCLDPTTSPSQF